METTTYIETNDNVATCIEIDILSRDEARKTEEFKEWGRGYSYRGAEGRIHLIHNQGDILDSREAAEIYLVKQNGDVIYEDTSHYYHLLVHNKSNDSYQDLLENKEAINCEYDQHTKKYFYEFWTDEGVIRLARPHDLEPPKIAYETADNDYPDRDDYDSYIDYMGAWLAVSQTKENKKETKNEQ